MNAKAREFMRLLRTACAQCGCDDSDVLEFAHFDERTKARNRSGRPVNLAAMNSKSRMVAELSLGRWLCSLCHRRETHDNTMPMAEAVKKLSPCLRENAMAVFKEKEKRGACMDCGLRFEEEIRSLFDFDHRDPSQKCFSLANVKHRIYTLNEMKAELLKTDLVCANCHRKRTLRQLAEKKAAKASKKRKFIEVE
jgi:hypothetical protein